LEILLGLITVKPRYNITSFIVHTTLWTETTSLTLSRFTAANCSDQMCIFWTHSLSYATRVSKLMSHLGFEIMPLGQSRLLSNSLLSCSRKYQGRLPASCKNTK